MRSSLKLGRLFGINIGIHWSWLLIFALLTWSFAITFFDDRSAAFRWIAGAIISVVFFSTILLHELSHSLMAKRRGIGVSSITLFVFGGVSNLEQESESARDEFWISIVGPLTSIALAVAFFVAWLVLRAADTGDYATVAGTLAAINLAIGIFNMLPGFPLDGGRVLRSILWGIKKNLLEATRIATRVGTFLAYGIIGLGVLFFFAGNVIGGIWFVLIGWFLQNAAEGSYQQTLLDRALSGISIGSITPEGYETVSPDTTVQELVNDHILPHSRRASLVTQDGEVVGIVTLSDVKEVDRDRWVQTRVRDIMTPRERLMSLRSEDDLRKALGLMQEHDINQIPVLEDGRIKGLVSRGDVIRVIQVRSEVSPGT